MKQFVRTILNYPVEGIEFRDITTLLQNAGHFKKVIDELLNNFKDHINRTKDNNNPGRIPNSLIINPDNQAPDSLYIFVGDFSDITPQPWSTGLKVIKIKISDIEQNKSIVERVFFIISM